MHNGDFPGRVCIPELHNLQCFYLSKMDTVIKIVSSDVVLCRVLDNPRNASAVSNYCIANTVASSYCLGQRLLPGDMSETGLDRKWIDPSKQPFLPVYIGEHIHVLFDKLVCTVLFTRNECSSS